MKRLFLILIVLSAAACVYGQQFYIRGEVKDESGNPLQNVNILLHSSGYIYHSGTTGAFGVMTNKQRDSITFSMDGYQRMVVVVNADNYLDIKLKMLPASVSALKRDKLSSATKDLTREAQREWFTGDETYASTVENRFINASKYPSTSVSLNIDRASYSNIRRFINTSSLVPPDAVRIEEMLNYFNSNYHQPSAGKLFDVQSVVTDCPWNPLNQLFFVNISSQKVNLDSLPPANLVFLIDVSGSMDMPNRLPLLQAAFRLLVNNLRQKDTVSIVIYGGAVGIMLYPTSGAEKDKINKAIDELTPGGSTPGESGIRVAYRLANTHFIKGGNNRVVLATDGDFNVGLQKEEELEEMIARQRQSGIYLTCLGVGMGNYKDSKIQSLARKGNGNFAYIDNYREAEKVLMKEFSQTLYAVADDVYMNAAFNPDFVKEYRLIGFDNKVGALKDSLSAVEGGEVGSGQSMMAVFEVEPTLKAKDTKTASNPQDTYAAVKLQYRKAGSAQPESFGYSAPLEIKKFPVVDSSWRFSAAVIMFGSLLKQSPVSKIINWNDIVTIATQATGENDILQKEFIGLVQQAKIIYSKQKRKKGSGN